MEIVREREYEHTYGTRVCGQKQGWEQGLKQDVQEFVELIGMD